MHEALPLFPQSLLTQSIDDRFSYFEDVIIDHPRLFDARHDVLRALRAPNPPRIIAVIGPTGSGKSTLMTMIAGEVLWAALPALETHPGRIPVVAVTATAPAYGGFHWDDYYVRALQALHEPLIDAKIDTRKSVTQSTKIGKSGIGVATLRWVLEQCLHYRETTAFLIDEGQYFTRLPHDGQLSEHAATIYSLAEVSNTSHVLFGTSELQALVRAFSSPHHNHAIIRVPHYGYTSVTERQEFTRVVYSFQCHLPLIHMPNLVDLTEYLYRGCLGCVGILKQWLLGALHAALADSQQTLTRPYLEQHVLEKPKLLRVAYEHREDDANGSQSDDLAGQLQTKRTRNGRSDQRRFGERKPKRDPVGR